MKLEEIVRFIFTNRNKILLLVLFVFPGFLNSSLAQTYRFEFNNNESVADALEKISDKFHFKVAFDAGKLKGIPADKVISGNNTDELIGNLLKNSSFYFKYKNNRYLIIPSTEVIPDDNECLIQGTISDAETGELLPHATIYITNQNISTSTSEAGTFSIKNIAGNPIPIKISFIGFHPIDTILYRSNSILQCNFKLSRKVQIMDSVVIKGIKVEMVDLRNDVDFATTLNPSKITDLPVVVESDIFKTLQLLPGISYTSNSSDLSIRGGSSDQNLILFDGQTIYNLSHYYGVVSNLNPNVIKDIQIYKGGYDSRYGERVSGIVDIRSKSGNQQKPSIYGDVNLICGNITAEIPIGKKISVIAAYRRSFSDIYKTSLSNNVSDNKPHSVRGDSNQLIYITTPSFYFYDYNSKVTYHVSEKENISINFFGSKDFFDNSYSGNAVNRDISTTDKNNWGSYGLSASWQKQWNENYFSNLQAGSSGYKNEYINNTSIIRQQNTGGPQPNLPEQNNYFNTNENNELTDISVSWRNIYNLNNRNLINFGILFRRNSILYHHDAEKIYIYNNLNQSSWITSFYLQDKYLVSPKLTLKPGLRFNYYNNTHSVYFEPRLATSYSLNNNVSVRLALGSYYQFISQVLSQQETSYNKNFWVLANDSTHPVIKSNHFIIGTTYDRGKFLIDAEMYYKNFSGLQEYLYLNPYNSKNPDFPNMFPGGNRKQPGSSNFKKSMNAPPPPYEQNKPSYFIEGIGDAIGLDFIIRYKTRKYTSWLSYSISKSNQKFQEINNNTAFASPADQTHQLSFSNMVTLGKWNVSTTTLFSTGRPYIDSTQNNKVLPVIRYYKRLPNYFRCDFSLNYNIQLGNLRLKAGATIVNVFNTQNYFDVNTRKFDFENTSFAETNLIRSQDLSLNLFLHFAL